VVVPVLLAGVAYQKFGWKGALATPIIAAVLATLVWGTSPLVRDRITAIGKDVELYEAGKMDQSVGQRFSFWKRSIIFIRAAPYLGNGTGSMASLFSQSAIGGIGADSIATTNPHNQLLAVAIQLGIVGAAALVCMWFAHAALFLRADLVSWLGFVVVCQNAVSSLFNSHLFDFSQGWIYVFGVGTIGGSILRRRQDRATPGQ
jgi:O-antigen ligase